MVTRIALLVDQAICPITRLLATVAAAEANSEHPIGAAIVKFAQEVLGRDIEGTVKDFQNVPGCGLKCNVTHIDDLVESANHSEAVINFMNQLK